MVALLAGRSVANHDKVYAALDPALTRFRASVVRSRTTSASHRQLRLDVRLHCPDRELH